MASRWGARSSRSSRSLGRRAFASSTVKSLGKEYSTRVGSASATDGQAIGEHLGKAGGPDLVLRPLYVVLDEAVRDVLILSEDIGGEGVPVARLAHGAGVHQVGTPGYSLLRIARFSCAETELIMYSSGSRTEPCTKSASSVCIVRGRVRRNSALSSLRCSRVHRTAAAASGLNQFRSVPRSVTARSWLPEITGIPSSRTMSQHSSGFAP